MAQATITIDGQEWMFTGVELVNLRSGDGFARRQTEMRVLKCGERFLVRHIDTALDIDGWDLLPSLDHISGWFGYCPLAIRLYQDLSIPVRRTA